MLGPTRHQATWRAAFKTINQLNGPPGSGAALHVGTEMIDLSTLIRDYLRAGREGTADVAAISPLATDLADTLRAGIAHTIANRTLLVADIALSERSLKLVHRAERRMRPASYADPAVADLPRLLAECATPDHPTGHAHSAFSPVRSPCTIIWRRAAPPTQRRTRRGWPNIRPESPC